MPKTEMPLISCVCITRSRAFHLKKAIGYFAGQSYPNKEMVIAYIGNDEETREFSKTIMRRDIRFVEIEDPDVSLGQMRNIAIKNSSGQYFCQWDDDDWYHPNRLQVQYQLMKENHKSASVLMNWFLYDNLQKQVYLSQTTAWAGSILCARILWDNVARYPDFNRSEDQEFIFRLFSGNYIYPIVMPYLYIYLYHGTNTCSKKHFKRMFALSQRLPVSSSRIVESIITDAVTYEEASRLMTSEHVLGEINYFHHLRKR